MKKIATEEEPRWRERERKFGFQDEGFIQVRLAGLYPLPSEGVQFVEPDWNLHGILRDDECEARFEQRMMEAEAEKVLSQEDAELSKHTEDESRKEETYKRKQEEEELEKAMAAEEKAARAEEKRVFAEEIEQAVRELRIEANEQLLRAAEDQIATLHSRAMRRDEVLEEEEARAADAYMESVQEQRERELEEEEERRFDQLLDQLDLDEHLQRISAEGEAEEREHVERQDRRAAMQQDAHLVSDVGEEAELERLARISEEEARGKEEMGDTHDGSTDSKLVLQMLLNEAKAKHEVFKGELRERHLAFVDKLRQAAAERHLEAEQMRKQEWAAGDRSFAESNKLLASARSLVDNMEEHVKQLNKEFKDIAERQDLWPMPKHRKPHSAGPVEMKARAQAAEAERVGTIGSPAPRAHRPPRPMTSPSRQRATQETEPELLVAAARGKAPTGFAHSVRVVFEQLDRKREGRLKEGDVAEGLQMLGLDATVSLSGLFGGVAGVDGIAFEQFQDMVLGVVGRQHAPARTPPGP